MEAGEASAWTHNWQGGAHSRGEQFIASVSLFAPSYLTASSTVAVPPLPLSLSSLPLFTAPADSLPLFPTSLALSGESSTTCTPSSSGVVLSSRLPVTSRPTGEVKQTKPAYKVAESIVPIPGKLVSRIQALEYVDMQELLPENLAFAKRLAALPQGLAPSKHTGEREIAGERALMTWVSAFAT